MENIINKSFEEIVAEIHKARENENYNRILERKTTGETEYINFCIWCNAFNNSKGKNDAKAFQKYLKEENVDLDFWQKKCLAEKYFGYDYDWDYTNNKWIIRKKII